MASCVHQVVIELYKWLGPLGYHALGHEGIASPAQTACYALMNLLGVSFNNCKIGTLGVYKNTL